MYERSVEIGLILLKIQKEYLRIAFEEPNTTLRLKALSLLEKNILYYQERIPSLVEVKK